MDWFLYDIDLCHERVKRKKANVFPIHKKGINKVSKAVVQFCFYLFMGKRLNICFIMLCLISFQGIIYFFQISLDSDEGLVY